MEPNKNPSAAEDAALQHELLPKLLLPLRSLGGGAEKAGGDHRGESGGNGSWLVGDPFGLLYVLANWLIT